MRTLQVHALRFCFEPVKEAVHEHDPKGPPACFENSLVVFTTIEAGDDDAIIPTAVESIIDHARQIGVKSIVLYPYAHLSSNLAIPSKARLVLEALRDRLSKLGYDVYKAPFGWYKRFLLEAAGHPLSELSRTIRTEVEAAGPTTLFSIESRSVESTLLEYFERFGVAISETGVYFSGYATSAIQSLLLDVVKDPIEGFLHTSTRPCDLEHGIAPNYGVVFPAYVRVKGRRVTYYEQAALAGREGIYKLLLCRAERIEEREKSIEIVGSGWSSTIAFRTSSNKLVLNAISTFLALIALETEKIKKAYKTPLLPYSISPIQAYIATAGRVSDEFVRQIAKELDKVGLRYYVDKSDRGLGSKIRDAGRLWVPLLIIVGAREESTNTVVVRSRENGKQEVIKLGALEEYVRLKATSIGYCLE